MSQSDQTRAAVDSIPPTQLMDIVYGFTYLSITTDFGQQQQQPRHRGADKAAQRRPGADTSQVHPSSILIGICDGCGSKEQVKMCPGCNNAQYCSKECQTAHWETHQDVCAGAT